jgi:N-formylglutamate amidohydrolase
VLQLEINRALYMNEAKLEPTPGFVVVQDILKTLIERLSSAALQLAQAA